MKLCVEVGDQERLRHALSETIVRVLIGVRAGCDRHANCAHAGLGEHVADRAADAGFIEHQEHASRSGGRAKTLRTCSMTAGFVTSALHHGADILRVMDVTRHREVSTLKTYETGGRRRLNSTHEKIFCELHCQSPRCPTFLLGVMTFCVLTPIDEITVYFLRDFFLIFKEESIPDSSCTTRR